MKKIDILGLHLGFGGTEQAIINQANMLCDKYEVRLVVTYKLLKESAFPIDERVKIIYLTSVRPNREQLKTAIKEKKVKKLFSELFYSAKVLKEKFRTMKNYIKTSDADIFISSRIEFHKILKKYAKKTAILIGEEHRYSLNDKKYLNRIKKSCSNFDYFVCVSNELAKAYQKLLKTPKCIYIPNALENRTHQVSQLKGKSIFTVGRLSPEKGFDDAIKIMEKVCKVEKNIKLYIIGDGSERKKLEKLVSEKNLEKNVVFCGFKDRNFIEKIALNSSLFLSVSHEESFGTVIIEAGSYGIPAVIFDSAKGPLEVIKNSENGIIVKNRNIEKAAATIISLLNDEKTLTKMGSNAQKNAYRYSFDNIKRLWYNLILKSLEENNKV